MIKNRHLTIQRSRFPLSHLHSCSSNIADPKTHVIRPSKSLLIYWWPCSWPEYTFPEPSFLLPWRSAHGLIPITTNFPVVFRRSTPTSHVSSSRKLVHDLNPTCSSQYTNHFSLLYFRSFAKGFFHKFIEPGMLKARRVNYAICPACDRSTDATMAQSQDSTVTAGQGRPSVSNVTPLDLYTDDPELLLPKSSLSVLGMQTTGVITTNWSFVMLRTEVG